MSLIHKLLVYVMAALYGAAGINHFIKPNFYLSIMPSFFPKPELLNYLSGAAEIILAIGLLFEVTRTISAYLIMVMLVVFFSVHIPHLFHPPRGAPFFLLILRIPIQFVLIYWAWLVSYLR